MELRTNMIDVPISRGAVNPLRIVAQVLKSKTFNPAYLVEQCDYFLVILTLEPKRNIIHD